MKNDFVYIDGKTPCYKSRLFIENQISHGFFTRKGGVSDGPFESLNFAIGVGELKDDEANVFQNYQIAAEHFGLNKEDVCRTYQTHTSVVEWADLVMEALPEDTKFICIDYAEDENGRVYRCTF